MINISVVELIPSLFLDEDEEEQHPEGGKKNLLLPLNEVLIFHFYLEFELILYL
jgi:hypothetical protein